MKHKTPLRRFVNRGMKAASLLHFHAQQPLAALLADAPPPPGALTARGVYCLEVATSRPLFARNAGFRLAPASLVKLATALVLLRRHPSLEDAVAVEEGDRAPGSTMGLQPGDIVTYRDLLHGLLAASGNDAAHVIARTLGARDGHACGERAVTRYVSWMNDLAREVGMRRSRFVNPSGWPTRGQYSTARDLAALGAAAFSNDAIRAACGAAVHKVRVQGRSARDLTIVSTVDLLGEPDVLAGKTGTAPAAGANLVLLSRSGGREIVTVLLACAARFKSARVIPGTDRRSDDARTLLAALGEHRDRTT